MCSRLKTWKRMNNKSWAQCKSSSIKYYHQIGINRGFMIMMTNNMFFFSPLSLVDWEKNQTINHIPKGLKEENAQVHMQMGGILSFSVSVNVDCGNSRLNGYNSFRWIWWKIVRFVRFVTIYEASWGAGREIDKILWCLRPTSYYILCLHSRHDNEKKI